jgi:prolyl oligopeptidase
MMTIIIRVTMLAGAVALAGCAREDITVPLPPPTQTQDIVDTLHGVAVPDPYRWLEDQDAPETRAWIDEQNAYADALLDQLPGRGQLREMVTRVLKRDVIGLPTERGGRYFFSKRRADQELAVVHVRDGVDGEDEVLIDPHPMSENHTTSVSLADISHDGSLVVYEVRDGGVDEVSIRVMDVATRADRPDVLPAARYGVVSLTPDMKGFFYERYGDVTPRVMYHALGTDPSDDRMLFGDGYERHHIPVTLLSDDGRWLVVHVIEGSSGPTEIHDGHRRRRVRVVGGVCWRPAGDHDEPRRPKQESRPGRPCAAGGRTLARNRPGATERRDPGSARTRR